MCRHATVDTSSDHRAPVSALKIPAQDFVQPTVAQYQRLQFETFGTYHVDGFLVFVGKSECIIVPSEMEQSQLTRVEYKNDPVILFMQNTVGKSEKSFPNEKEKESRRSKIVKKSRENFEALMINE